jgi:ring-1,2-phenylacetyl-CoA epoxidase subunit PaaE
VADATPRFHRLRVAEVRRETADAISVTFDVPPALRAAYVFRAGQYLTLRAAVDGAVLRRSYSICAGEDDGELRIAIKRVQDGAFSAWAHETLAPGAEIDVMTPTGRFGRDAPAEGVHVGICAGSGITPVLSLMRTVLARASDTRFVLLYGSRATSDILFRSALEDLKDRYLSRVAVLHVLSRERQDIDVLNGRLDPEKLATLLHAALGGAPVAAAYVCGPEAMVPGAEAALAQAGVEPARVHVERFTSAHDGRPRAAPPPVPADAPAHAHATVVIDGRRADVPLAAGETVLDAALRAGLDLPFACKGGMCSTCRARLVEGSVAMEVNYSLEPWELAEGFVLTCQARPTSPHLLVDYDRQ